MRLYNKSRNKDFKAMIRISLVAFLAELPNFVLTVISAIVSNTPVVWVDTVNSLGETFHCFLVFLVTLKLQKNNEDKYNYGTERLEVLSSFCCDLLVILGMVSVAAGAVIGIINPELPSDNLLMFLIIKISNCLWDAVFLYTSIKAAKKAKSQLGNSEVRNYTKALVFDVIVGIVVGITYIFRSQTWMCYANPIVSIILVIIFIVLYIKKIKESIGELTDKSIPLLNQDQIFDVILQNPQIVKTIEEINCRTLNKKTYVEVCIKMNDDVTYKEQTEYLDVIRKEIKEIVPDCVVKLIIGQSDYN